MRFHYCGCALEGAWWLHSARLHAVGHRQHCLDSDEEDDERRGT